MTTLPDVRHVVQPRETEPPRETAPPPVRGELAVTVSDEFCNEEFGTLETVRMLLELESPVPKRLLNDEPAIIRLVVEAVRKEE